MLPGDGHNRIHFSGESEQMDRNDGARIRSYSLLDERWIDIECVRQNIDEYRFCSGARDRARRRYKCKGRGDHFVAGPDTLRTQRQIQGVRARCATHGEWGPNVFGRILLEQFYLLPEYEMLTFQNGFYGLQNLSSDCRELRLKVKERNTRFRFAYNSRSQFHLRFISLDFYN